MLLLENSFWKKIQDAIGEAAKALTPYFQCMLVLSKDHVMRT